MKKTIENSGSAFPPATGSADGMTLREFAAIKLRVPNSDLDWLDDMIRESLRDEFAGKALAHIPLIMQASEQNLSLQNIAQHCYQMADAMMAARKEKP